MNTLMQRGTVAIPKTARIERLTENFAIFDFELSADDMTAIQKLDRKVPLVDPIEWWGFPYF